MEGESIYRDLLDSLSDGVYFTDRERRIIYWNKGAERITGYRSEEVLGKRCMDNILMHVDGAGCQLCISGCPLSGTMQDGKPRNTDVFLRHKEGHRIPVAVRASALRNADGEIAGAVEVFNDISDKVRLAERLEEMERHALLDPLSGLTNRNFLEIQTRSRLEELRRNGWPFGLLFIDIDNFKLVNDVLGHDMGDRVIRMIGRTLDASSRYFDTVGRWGGDEFIAVIANAKPETLGEIGERFRSLVEHTGLATPVAVKVTISIGGTLAVPEDTVSSLVRRADQNLYRAKESGRNRICL
jgi:diguanylate cyclase (GGDEF)-like protein/PAS domain S-box-containing protein